MDQPTRKSEAMPEAKPEGKMEVKMDGRRSRRLPTRIQVRWLRRSGSTEVVATDINRDGLFLCTKENVPPGALLQIALELPDGPLSMFVTARFIGQTQSGRGIGVEIHLVSPPDYRRFLTYYASLMKDELKRSVVVNG
jgi:hypothetical protein